MNRGRAATLLEERITELKKLRAEADAPEFASWRQRTKATLRATHGDGTKTSDEFDHIIWTPGVYPASPESFTRSFESGRRSASALLSGLVYELRLEQDVAGPDTASFDPELWSHVAHSVAAEQWAQVASQTAIFVESKIRGWSGRPAGEVGQALMSAVLKPEGGVFPLGRTDAEMKAWLNFGLGFSGAAGNVDRHRIQARSDLKQYAMGVLGAGSLLLTQLRFEHGNRFRG